MHTHQFDTLANKKLHNKLCPDFASKVKVELSFDNSDVLSKLIILADRSRAHILRDLLQAMGPSARARGRWPGRLPGQFLLRSSFHFLLVQNFPRHLWCATGGMRGKCRKRQPSSTPSPLAKARGCAQTAASARAGTQSDHWTTAAHALGRCAGTARAQRSSS
jgi:hypothetical protein